MRGMRRADELEADVWDFVTGLMKDPEQLRADLERALEQERRDRRGDPEREAKAWHGKLAEVKRKRCGFQDMAAEGLVTLDELRAKLAGLEEARTTAERELEALRSRREKLEAMEQDKEAVLETYARMAPEALDSLTPEERHQFYKMLRLRVVVQPDDAIELSGAFTDGQGVCTLETTSHDAVAAVHIAMGPHLPRPRLDRDRLILCAWLTGSGVERLELKERKIPRRE